eukprot:COSAG04_NODE_15446_length_531_cov_2.166667_2_plen_57_part_01
MGLLGVALLALPFTALAEPPQVERFSLFEGELLLRAGQPPTTHSDERSAQVHATLWQ